MISISFQLPPATARAVRHSVYRYLLLAYILILRDVSISVKKQFPTYKHLIQAKLLTEWVGSALRISFLEFFLNFFWRQFFIGLFLSEISRAEYLYELREKVVQSCGREVKDTQKRSGGKVKI